MALTIDLALGGRILYIASQDVSVPNGPGVNEREFVRALGRSFGERVHFLLPYPRFSCSDIDRGRTTFYRGFKKMNPLAFFLYQFDQSRQAERLLRAGEFDLVVVRMVFLPFGIARSIRRSSTPLAIKTIGNPDALSQQPGIRGRVGRVLRSINYHLIRNLTRRAVAIDACTNVLLKHNQNLFAIENDKMILVQNSVNVERFFPVDRSEARRQTGLSEFDPIIGYVGGSPWERGARQMLELGPKLIKKYPGLGLVIVGEEEGEERIRSCAQRLGVSEHVVVTGGVSYERVPAFVGAFDVGLALDRPDRVGIVGNSFQKVRQYIACGRPVITSPGGDGFVQREGLGSIVDAEDLVCIESAIESWLSLDATDRIGFVRRSSAYARQHLSTEVALERRISFWHRRLACDHTREKTW